MNEEKRTSFLDRKANYYKRNFTEMLFIKSEPNILNAQTDANTLKKINCLLKIKKYIN